MTHASSTNGSPGESSIQPPRVVRFTKGIFKGLTFTRGSGAESRLDIGGGISVLLGSSAHWYCGNARQVDLGFLQSQKDSWVRVQS